MATHNQVGTAGEEAAAAWLVANGYALVHRNWRYSYFEIDIIATRNEWLHFIEVKARNQSNYGHPEDAVTRRKFKRLQRAADQYLFLYPGSRWIQYDVLTVSFRGDEEPVFFILEDVYYQ